MATVTGPLFSVTASGQIAGAIVYSTWKGRPYVRQHAVPANPKSVGQLSMRAMMRFLTQYWASMSGVEQADWETRAAVTNISPFNAFVSYNMTRWGLAKYPSLADPATETNTPAVTANDSATAGVRSITLSIEVTTLNDGWGAAIFRKLTTGVAAVRNELVQMIPADSAAVFTWLDFPLTPGVEQFYLMAGFTDDGVLGTPGSEVSATPTT